MKVPQTGERKPGCGIPVVSFILVGVRFSLSHNQKFSIMPNSFKNGVLVIYAPETSDQHYAVFLHSVGEMAFIRLCETLEVKRLCLTKIHPNR